MWKLTPPPRQAEYTKWSAFTHQAPLSSESAVSDTAAGEMTASHVVVALELLLKENQEVVWPSTPWPNRHVAVSQPSCWRSQVPPVVVTQTPVLHQSTLQTEVLSITSGYWGPHLLRGCGTSLGRRRWICSPHKRMCSVNSGSPWMHKTTLHWEWMSSLSGNAKLRALLSTFPPVALISCLLEAGGESTRHSGGTTKLEHVLVLSYGAAAGKNRSVWHEPLLLESVTLVRDPLLNTGLWRGSDPTLYPLPLVLT